MVTLCGSIVCDFFVCYRYCCAFLFCSVVVFFFFFQAEDGIRDLVRSRGLGDVYKRQVIFFLSCVIFFLFCVIFFSFFPALLYIQTHTLPSVSYTHLTLPTSDLV